MRFEWDENKNRDENKNQANIRKHGLDFVKAAEAFSDKNQVLKFDGYYGSEDRWSVIGFTSDLTLVVVVHVFRDAFDEEVIRLISARPATRTERRYYARENRHLSGR
jgi:uncharacterized protein